MSAAEPRLSRRLGPLQATALNMSNMIGVGPFITIPLLMTALGGPQAMLGWIVAVLIAIADGMIWSELGAAMPGSGGSYVYLREAFGRMTLGRLMAFLFIWQFILSGPLEIASGYIGFAKYAGYIWSGITPRQTLAIAVAVGLVNISLLYRKIASIGKITVSLWIGTLLTTLAVIVTGARHFSAARAFDFPPGAFHFSIGYLFGLGAASRVGVYDYLGYYDICYLGDEVQDPGRTIPRSILISVVAVAFIYLAVNLSIIGVVSWREFVPASTHPASDFVVSIFMEKIYGRRTAVFFTAMVLWTAFGSVFALLLGYSRVPFAAARDGYFFKVFGKLHPTKNFPHVSLVVLGLISIACSFLSLDAVIDALITTRILVQFIGQIAAVHLLRKREPDSARPYKMWLYPLPSAVALVGWLFIFATADPSTILMGLVLMTLGGVAFLAWSKHVRQWPFAAALALLVLVPPRARAASFVLHDGWSIQSSALAKEQGAEISSVGFSTRGWHAAVVPSTVLGTLVDEKAYPDPFYGMNLRLIPGTTAPIGENFSDLPTPTDSPFRPSWWYRVQFRAPLNFRGRHAWLRFDGVNFRAAVWLNGRRVDGADPIAGTFTAHEFDVGADLRPGELNALAVEVVGPQPHELAWTWVDWSPSPPDKNMGIFRPVALADSGPVALRHPQAVAHFDLPSFAVAHLTVDVEAINAVDREIKGVLKGRIGGVSFSQTLTLAPHERRTVSFTPERYPQLNLSRPRLWWPANMGRPSLYHLTVEFVVDGAVSDRQRVSFGVRQVTSELDAKDHRLFKVNGRNVLIRGGGWAADMFLRPDSDKLKADFEYVKDMNLNAIRLEGQLESDDFFDMADREGLLIMAGWPCCSRWEQWTHISDYPVGPVWGKEDYAIAARSQTDQILRLRAHPSVFVWLNGSDNPPPPDVEKMYLEILDKNRWPNPSLSSASDKPTVATSSSGVKMAGPYDWVPPNYWQLDKTLGGAHGFATEISPGPAVPTIESLRRMIPPEHLWPIDDAWNFHAGGGQFKDLKIYTAALEARYGAAKDAPDFAAKSQLMAYEGQRAMFEAYGAGRYGSTGVIQWMLNNAWPSMIWHLYDFYMTPGGGYFGTKKACEPVHAQYSYADKTVVVVNTTPDAVKNIIVTAQIFDIGLTKRFERSVRLVLAADSSTQAVALPKIEGLSTTYFLRLKLRDGRGAEVGDNFYWLSTKDDDLAWDKSTWYYTPAKAYADMTALQSLPPARLTASARATRSKGREIVRVSLSNPGSALAFFTRLRVVKARGDADIQPILWQDNFVSILPGEKKELSASFDLKHIGEAPPLLLVEAWNSVPLTVPIATE